MTPGTTNRTIFFAILNLRMLHAALLVASPADLRTLIDSGSLAQNPNSVLLDYLLNEGREVCQRCRQPVR